MCRRRNTDPGSEKKSQRRRAQLSAVASGHSTLFSDGLFLSVHGPETSAMVMVPPFGMTDAHPHTVTQNPSSDAFRTRTPNTQEASSAPRTRCGAEAWGEPVFAQPDPADHTHPRKQQQCSSQQPSGGRGPQGPFPSAVVNTRNYFNPHMELSVTFLHHLLH